MKTRANPEGDLMITLVSERDPNAITHDEEARRFELTVSEIQSTIDYEFLNGVINITRVYVPYELTGRGLASILARHVLNYARENNLKVIPTCSFIKLYIQKHPEYQDLLTRFGNFITISRGYYKYE